MVVAELGSTVRAEALRDFCIRAFETMGVQAEDAQITADVLVQANLRGIDSHGVARLARYIDGLRHGVMQARPEEKVVALPVKDPFHIIRALLLIIALLEQAPFSP